jgi:hypothetical protein
MCWVVRDGHVHLVGDHRPVLGNQARLPVYLRDTRPPSSLLAYLSRRYLVMAVTGALSSARQNHSSL